MAVDGGSWWWCFKQVGAVNLLQQDNPPVQVLDSYSTIIQDKQAFWQ
jgi:hypothetical protein